MENFEKFDSVPQEQLSAEPEDIIYQPSVKSDEAMDPAPMETDLSDPGESGRTVTKKVADNWQKNVLLYLHDILYLVAALIIVSLLFLRVVVVSGTSMNNTLLDGDYLFVLSNSIYQEPKQGDIVVISKESFENGAPIVKRVIATEGQTVDIDFNLGIVYVDGEALVEPYTLTATINKEGMSFPLTVEEDCIFVLGDNRAVSRDSRSPEIGLIDEQEVLGKVIFLFLPGTNKGQQPLDWSRIGVVK